VVGDDLGLPVSLAAIVVPAPGLDPTLDRDLLTLAEELAARLSETVPGWFVVEQPGGSGLDRRDQLTATLSANDHNLSFRADGCSE
jgi:hypothetical protein